MTFMDTRKVVTYAEETYEHFTDLTDDVFIVAAAIGGIATVLGIYLVASTEKRRRLYSYILLVLSSLTFMGFAAASGGAGLIIGSSDNEKSYALGFRDQNQVHLVLGNLLSPVVIWLLNVASGIGHHEGNNILVCTVLSNLFGTAAYYMQPSALVTTLMVGCFLMGIPVVVGCLYSYNVAVKDAPTNIRTAVYVSNVLVIIICLVSCWVCPEAYINGISPDVENLIYTVMGIVIYVFVPFLLVGDRRTVNQIAEREETI